MFQTKVVEKIKTNFVFSNILWKSLRLWDYVEKYCRAGQATGDNTVPTNCMLGTNLQTHTLSLYDNYFFPRRKLLQERVSLLRYSTLPV
jgi:hypothetical protein